MGLFNEIIGYISSNPQILLGFGLLYLIVKVVQRFFSGSKPGPNPFTYDSTKPVKPFEKDQSARDKVLKQGFVTKKIPDNLDAIVIGSGIGGLTTASILSRIGKKVLVLEQHDQAGGCCHTFNEKGYEFDVGIHYIGEMTTNSLSKCLVDQLTDGQLQWAPLDDEYDIVAINGKKFPMKAGKTAYRERLVELFPDEVKAIDKYLKLVKMARQSTMGLIMVKFMPKWIVKILIATRIINLMTSYYKYSAKSLTQVLDELTDNNDLKAVLGYCFGDYGTIPKDTCFTMHAMLIYHFMYGASYPAGGASEIAYNIIPTIEASGGRVLVRAPVTKILTDDKGVVNGVRVLKTSGDVDIQAPLVISNAGVLNTFKMVPKDVAAVSGIPRTFGPVKNGMGAMSLFVGLKGTKEELGLKASSIWAFTGNKLDEITEDYYKLSAEEAANSDIPLLFISFPSTKDPMADERFPGKSTCTIVTLGRWEWFSQWKDGRVMHRGDDYEALKKGIADHMWQQCLAFFPQLEDKVEYFDLGTPISNNFYIASNKGEIYGIDHNKERFTPRVQMHLRPDTGIPGLYLTGQDIFVCGFSGAMYGGLLCAASILNRNIFKDLVKLKSIIGKDK